MRARLPMVFKFTDGKVVSCLVAPVPLERVRCRWTRVVVEFSTDYGVADGPGCRCPAVFFFSKSRGSGCPEGLKEPVFQGEIPG